MAALAKPAVGMLARYDAMVTAIAECLRVDEVKDIRDKAVALEAYYRQAKNTEAEIEAANVRLRAERRAGELLKELARADAPNPNGVGGKSGKIDTSHAGTQQSPYAAALETNGMSRQTAHRFQALANVPQETFERALKGPDRPSARRIIAEVATQPAKPKVSDDALWLWGVLRDFERGDHLDLEVECSDVLASMTDAMRGDVRRIVPTVIAYLERVEADCEPA